MGDEWERSHSSGLRSDWQMHMNTHLHLVLLIIVLVWCHAAANRLPFIAKHSHRMPGMVGVWGVCTFVYTPSRALDHVLQTAWAEGMQGPDKTELHSELFTFTFILHALGLFIVSCHWIYSLNSRCVNIMSANYLVNQSKESRSTHLRSIQSQVSFKKSK